jgi:hypothetical protein
MSETWPASLNLIARGLVLVALTIATGGLLTAVPVGSVWLAAQATDSIGEHFVAAVPLTALAMVAWFVLVVWLNNLYLRINGTLAQVEADARSGWRQRQIRGPAEPLLVFWFFAALIALFVWFFLLAENPPRQVI